MQYQWTSSPPEYTWIIISLPIRKDPYHRMCKLPLTSSRMKLSVSDVISSYILGCSDIRIPIYKVR